MVKRHRCPNAVVAMSVCVLLGLLAVCWQRQTLGNVVPSAKESAFSIPPLESYEKSPAVPLDKTHEEWLSSFVSNALKAYVDRRPDDLRLMRARIPEWFASVPDVEFQLHFLAIDRLILKMRSEIRTGFDVSGFEGERDFALELESCFELAFLYGDILMRRKDFPGLFCNLEADMMRRLLKYRQCALDAGRKDLAEATEGFLVRLKRHIESDGGYTRARVVRDVAFARKWGFQDMLYRNMSWERVLGCAVHPNVRPLVDQGYTPQWVDGYMQTSCPGNARTSAQEETNTVGSVRAESISR